MNRLLLLISLGCSVICVCFAEPIFLNNNNLGGLYLAKSAFVKGAVIGSLLSNAGNNNRRSDPFNYGGGWRRDFRRRNGGFGRRGGRRGNRRGQNSAIILRLRRSVEGGDVMDSMEKMFLQASIEDSNDCVKKFVCVLSTESSTSTQQAMSPLEKNVADIFAPRNLDVTSDAAEFELAAAIGRNTNINQCQKIYARCPLTYEDIREAMEEEKSYVEANEILQ